MTTVIRKWGDLTITDGTVLTLAMLGMGAAGTIQPTSGNRWVWDATLKMPKRTLDAVGGNYLRETLPSPVTTTKTGMLRWFYYPGADPSAVQYPMGARTTDPVDSARAGVSFGSTGLVRPTYNSSTLAGTGYDMSALAAGYYAVEILADALASSGKVTAWLYSEDLLTEHAEVAATGLAFASPTNSFGNFRFGGMTASGTWTEDRLKHGFVAMAGETLVDNMLRDAWLASVTSPPTLTLYRVANNVVDARASAAGSAGALTFSVSYISGENNLVGVEQLASGILVFPEPSTGTSTYRITVTEAGSGMTDTEDVVITEGAGGSAITGIIFDVWSGSAWV